MRAPIYASRATAWVSAARWRIASARSARPGRPIPRPISRARGSGCWRATTRGAAADIAEALRRDPASPFALELRALLLMRHGDIAGAARDTEAARARRPRVTMILTEVFGNQILR